MTGFSAPSLLVTLLFTFASTIFYLLLLIGRCAWVFHPAGAPSKEADVRFVHQSLRHIIPVLPPSNGVAVIGGLGSIVWQGVRTGWSWQSLTVLAFWTARQLYIIVVGRSVAAIRDVRSTPSDGCLEDVSRGVSQLIRQHRNGLVHAVGVLTLQLALGQARTLTVVRPL